MGGEQDVQYDRALITGQRIVQTERNMSNLQKNDVDEYNITLFSNVLSDTEIFMVEALGSAVINTACTRTVFWEKWLDDYISELPQSELQKFSDKTECKTF